MTKTSSRPTMKAADAVGDARRAVLQERDKLADLEAELTATASAYDDLDTRAGSVVLDDPAAAERVARELSELQARTDLIRRAVEAQRPRVAAAERTFLEAEAEALSAPAAAANRKLEAHEKRTAELLDQLRAHEGTFVPKGWLDEATVALGTPREVETYVSDRLRDELERAELPVLVLREMAQGRDPAVHPRLMNVPDPADVYPAVVWGEDALVPAPAWIRRLEREAQAQEQHRDAIARVEATIADLEEQIANPDPFAAKVPEAQNITLAAPLTLEEKLVRARKQLEDLHERTVEPAAAAG